MANQPKISNLQRGLRVDRELDAKVLLNARRHAVRKSAASVCAESFKRGDTLKHTQPAGARGIAEARNGEAEAVANAVGREAVAHWGCARILGKEPSVRCAPTTRRESADTLREIGGRVTGTGRSYNLHTPDGAPGERKSAPPISRRKAQPKKGKPR